MKYSLIPFSLILLQLVAQSEQKVCPLHQVNYRDNNCNQIGNVEIVEVEESSNSNTNPFCKFIEDGLYKVSCSNDNNNLVTFSPCFTSNTYLQSEDRTIGTCYPSKNGREGEIRSYKLFGSCENVNNGKTCASFTTPSPTNQPTSSPTFEPAAFVKLSAPLPKNDFADELLDLDTAYDSVLLQRLIYNMESYADALTVVPSKFTVHSYYDTISAECLIVSTDHEMDLNGEIGTRGKIFVTFRGTDESADGDWLTNLNAVKVSEFINVDMDVQFYQRSVLN